MIIKFPPSIERILITGGAGFIGGAMIRRLIKNTSAKIFNLDKISYASDLTSINNLIDELSIQHHSRYQLVKVDLTDKEKTRSAIKEVNPDFVFHFAAESHVDRSIDDPYSFIDSNVIGTLNLLHSCLEHWDNLPSNKKENFRIHHISTDEVYGSLGREGSFSEETAYDPSSPYAASKAASDHLVNAWHNTYGLPVIKTNCSNNFGPWQFPEKLIPLVILKALDNKPIPLYGDGMNIRDWLFIDDHIDAILLAAIKGNIGETYCIGGQQEKTNKEVVTAICHLIDEIRPTSKSHVELITHVKDRPGHDKRYAINSDKIKKELNWVPLNNFDIGLRKTVDWYTKNIQWSRNILKRSNYSGERIGISLKNYDSSA